MIQPGLLLHLHAQYPLDEQAELLLGRAVPMDIYQSKKNKVLHQYPATFTWHYTAFRLDASRHAALQTSLRFF